MESILQTFYRRVKASRSFVGIDNLNCVYFLILDSIRLSKLLNVITINSK